MVDEEFIKHELHHYDWDTYLPEQFQFGLSVSGGNYKRSDIILVEVEFDCQIYHS